MYAILQEAIALSETALGGQVAPAKELRVARQARTELESVEDLILQDLDFLFLFNQESESIHGSPAGEEQ